MTLDKIPQTIATKVSKEDFYSGHWLTYLVIYSNRCGTPQPGNTNGGSITVLLTSCLTSLESSV